MEYIFAAGLLVSLVLCIASMFTPRTVKFLKSPGKVKGILFWFFISMLCFSGTAATIPKTDKPSVSPQAAAPSLQSKQPSQSEQQNSQQASATQQVVAPQPVAPDQLATKSEQAPLPNDFNRAPTPDEEKEYAAARERMAKKTLPVQAELNKLYKELLSMRNTSEFKQLGFSGKNKTSSEWKNRVNALAERIKTDDDIPIMVKIGPSYLIQLGMDKAWREGATTSDSKWNTQMVQDALNWKLEE